MCDSVTTALQQPRGAAWPWVCVTVGRHCSKYSVTTIGKQGLRWGNTTATSDHLNGRSKNRLYAIQISLAELRAAGCGNKQERAASGIAQQWEVIESKVDTSPPTTLCQEQMREQTTATP
jgi:hypothetical protein